jgi:hypothetical protein
MALKLTSPLRGFEARRALKTARRRADEEILATRLPSPRLAWRVAELVSEENRVDLGRSLTDVVQAADERLLPTASPLDRVAVREARPQLLALAGRLYDTSQTVTARGVLLVDKLLVDGNGLLYGHSNPARLAAKAEELFAVLAGNDPA